MSLSILQSPLRPVLFLLLFCCQALLSGMIHYVSPVGSGNGDGRSWGTAASSLQETINRASPGDSIWLAAGTYHPEKIFSFPDRHHQSCSFLLKDGVNILGGFAGTEATPDQRQRQDLDGNGLTEAWEYAAETILEGRSDAPGSVLISGPKEFVLSTLMDGLTIRNGQTVSQQSSPRGGGGWLNGTITLANSRILNNSAQLGGGLYLQNKVTVIRCLISGNILQNDCWNSCGGGLYLDGIDCSISYCLITANGTAMQGGGGIYSRGIHRISRCVFAGNRSLRYGSGIRFDESPAILSSSLFWKNLPEQTQIYPGGATVRHNACTQFLPGNLCLQPENAGPEGIEINSNRPDCFYACLVSPEKGNYSPAAGSALINRGEPPAPGAAAGLDASLHPALQFGHPDTGCYESPHPGNLALDFHLSRPLYCGSTSTLLSSMPVDQQTFCTFVPAGDAATGRLRSAVPQTRITAAAPGRKMLAGSLQPSPEEAANWNTRKLVKEYEIQKRRLILQGDHLVWENGPLPELTWALIQGELLPGDQITGVPALLPSPGTPGIYEYSAGTLAIQPESSRHLYELIFQPGSLECRSGGAAEIQFSSTDLTYNAEAQSPVVSTIPPDLPLRLTYKSLPSGSSLSSEQVPVKAGSYSLTAEIQGNFCSGRRTINFTITPAPLTCTVQDCEMYYGDPLPEFQLDYQGFQGKDGPENILPPEIITEASPESEPGRTYKLQPSGGSAENYSFVHIPGSLTIRRILPKINESLAGICTYGTPMKHILLMAFATDPRTGEFVPGEFVWDNPETVSPAGDWEYSWTFLPENRNLYDSVKGITQVYVARREISVSALPHTKIYGEPDPQLAYEITAGALAFGDSFAQLLVRIPGEAPGDYSITLNNPGQYPDYEITFLQNFLTIRRRQITVQAENKEKFFQKQDPELTYLITKGSLAFNDHFSGEIRRSPGENPGSYTIVQGSLNLPESYELHFIDGTFLIRSPELFVRETLPAFTIQYGQLPGELALNFTVRRNDSDAPVAGTLNWQNPRTRLLPGTHDLPWIFIPDENDIFKNLTGVCSIEVTKAPLQAVFNKTYSREFQMENPVFSYSLRGFQFEDNETMLESPPEINCDCRTDSMPGSYKIRTSGGQDPRYDFLHGQTSLEITPGTLSTETGAPPPVVHQDTGGKTAALTYGEPLRKLELRGSIFNRAASPKKIDGRLSWQNPEEILHAGVFTRRWIFEPSEPGYSPLSGNIEITVRPRALKIICRDCSLEIGEPLPNPAPVYEGFVNGDGPTRLTSPPVLQCEAEDSNFAGIYSLAFANAAAEDYQCIYVPAKMTIRSIALLPEETFPEFRFSYGTAPEEMHYRGKAIRRRDGMEIPGTYRWQNTGLMPDAGLHHFNWKFVPDRQPEQYSPLTGSQAVHIDPLPVQVIAESCRQIYGEPELPLTYLTPDFQNLPEDFFSGSLTRSPGHDAGSYPILQGSLRCLPNYQIQFVSADYIIEPKTLTVTISPLQKTYGDPEPVFTCKTDDQEETARLSGTVTRSPGENAGSYSFSKTGLVISSNYNLRLSSNTFTINPRKVTITADSGRKYHATDDPPFTWQTSQGNILPADSPSGSLTRESGEAPGCYRITRGSLSLSGNYALTFVPGELIVLPAPLAPSSQPEFLSAEYGQFLTPSLLNFRIVHAVTGKAVPGSLQWNSPGEKLLPGNITRIWNFTPEQPELYTPLSGEMQIKTAKKHLQVKIRPPYSRKYQDSEPEFQCDFTGFVFQDSPEDLADPPAVYCTADKQSLPGKYLLETRDGQDDRYDFVHDRREYTVTPGILLPSGNPEEEPPLQFFHAGTGSSRAVLVYGEPLSTLKLTGCFYNRNTPPEKIRGTARWQQPSAILPAGLSTQKWTFTPDSGLYETISGETEIQILKAELVVAAPNISIEADQELPDLSPAYEGFVNHEDTQVLKKTAVLQQQPSLPLLPGRFTLNYTGAEALNYRPVYRPGLLHVLPVALLPDENFPEIQIPYGSSMKDLNWRGQAVRKRTGEKIAGLYRWQEQDRIPPPGTTAYSWEFIPDRNQEKYAVLTGQHQITVKRQILLVSAVDQTQVYGADSQKLTYRIAGLPNPPEGLLSGSLIREPGEDAGNYRITQGSLSCQENFQIQFTPGTYTITPCPVTVTVLPESKHYGDQDPHFQYLTDNADLQSSISGAVIRTSGEDLGAYSFSTEQLQYSSNYRLTLATRLFRIIPRPLTVQANRQQKYHGSPDPSLSWTILSGSLLPGHSFSGSLLRTGGELPGSYQISQGSLALPSCYSLSFQPAEFLIQPALPVLHPVPEMLNATYGDFLSPALLNYQVRHSVTGAPIPGSLVWLQPDSRLLPGRHFYGWRFIPENSSHTQTISGEIEIDTARAPLTVSLLEGYSRLYLSANPEFKPEFTGLKFEDRAEDLAQLPEVHCDADRLSSPGFYPVTLYGGRDDRYEFIYRNSTLEILPDELPANPENKVLLVHSETESMDGILIYGEPLSHLRPAALFYTQDNPPIQITGTIKWKEPETVYPAGVHSAEWDFMPDKDCYLPLSGSIAITVNPAPLVISVPDYEIQTKDSLPIPELRYAGFVNGDTREMLNTIPEITFSCENSDTPGEFQILIGTATADNYSITCTPGTLRISRHPIEVTPGLFPLVMTYDQELKSLVRLLSVQRISDKRKIAGSFTLDSSSKHLPVGQYVLDCKFRPKDQKMYPDLQFQVPVTVQKYHLHLTIRDVNTTYGDPEVPLTYSTDSALPPHIQISGTLRRTPGRDAGTYDILGDGLSAGPHVEIHAPPGSYVIRRRPLRLKTSAFQKNYGDPDPPLTFTCEDSLCYDDQISENLSRKPGEAPGTYACLPGQLALSRNYNLSFSQGGSLVIQPRPLTVTFGKLEKLYGDPDPPFTWTLSEEKFRKEASISGSPRRDPGENCRKYEITQSNFKCNSKFSLNFVPGHLIIRQKPIILDIIPKSKFFSDPDPRWSWQLAPNSPVPDAPINGTLRRQQGENQGVYQFLPGSLNIGGNYCATFTGGFTIMPKPVTIQIDNAEKMLGNPDPAFTWSILTPDVSRQMFQGNLQIRRTPGEERGYYNLTCTGHSCSRNFNPTIQNGKLLIKEPGIIFRNISAAVIRYGEPLKNSPISGDIIYSDGQQKQTGTFTWEFPDVMLRPGTYKANWSCAVDKFPDQLYSGQASVTVLPKIITVRAVNCFKQYQTADPQLRFEVDNRDFVNMVPPITGSPARTGGEMPGAYTITRGNLSFGPDYELDFIDGTFNIGNPVITVNPIWEGCYHKGQSFTWENQQFIYQVNAAATLDEAMLYCLPGGTINLCAGYYYQSSQDNSNKNLIIQSDNANEAVILSPLQLGGPDTDKIILKNLVIDTTDDQAPPGNTAALTLSGGAENISLNQVFIRGGSRDAMHIRGAARILAEHSSFHSTAGTCLQILPGENGTLNSNIRFQNCSFNTSSPDQYYVQLHDDRMNPESQGCLPMTGCSFDGQTVSGPGQASLIPGIKKRILDADSLQPTSRGRVMLLEESREYQMENVSYLGDEHHTITLKNIPANYSDYSFLIQLTDEKGRVQLNHNCRLQSRSGDISLPVENLPVGKYEISIHQLTPADGSTLSTIYCAPPSLSRMPPLHNSLDKLTVERIPSSPYYLPAGGRFQYKVTACVGHISWDVTPQATLSYDSRLLMEIAEDGEKYLCSKVAGTHELTFTYEGRTAVLQVPFEAAPTVWFTDSKPADTLLMGEYHYFDYNFYDKYGNKTSECIKTVETQDKEYLHSFHNALLLDIDVPFAKTDLMLISNQDRRIPVSKKIASPGNDWCLTWALSPIMDTLNGEWVVYIYFQDPGNIIKETNDMNTDDHWYSFGSNYYVRNSNEYHGETNDWTEHYYLSKNMNTPIREGEHHFSSRKILKGTRSKDPCPGYFLFKERKLFFSLDDPIMGIANVTNGRLRWFFIRQSKLLEYQKEIFKQ